MRGLILAISFLTVLPVGRDMRASDQDIGNSLAWYPLVGFFLGSVSAGVCYLLYSNGLTLAADVLAVALLVFLTGALHVDGLMDTADGLFCHRDKEQRLSIMKDSRVGAMGVTAAVCVLLFKIAFLFEIPMPEKLFFLMLAPAVGRLAMVFCMIYYPYARKKGGLGEIFNKNAKKIHLLISIILVMVGSVFLLGIYGLIFLAVGLMFSAALAWYISGKLGGLTGDTYGAIGETTETVVLVMGAVLWGLI